MFPSHDRVLKGLDMLREDLGPVTVNNWYWAGKFQNRGLRTSKYYKGRVSYSQHTFGRAFDFDVKGMSAEQVRIHIRANHSKYGITAIENGVNWVHADWRNCEPLKQFTP